MSGLGNSLSGNSLCDLGNSLSVNSLCSLGNSLRGNPLSDSGNSPSGNTLKKYKISLSVKKRLARSDKQETRAKGAQCKGKLNSIMKCIFTSLGLANQPQKREKNKYISDYNFSIGLQSPKITPSLPVPPVEASFVPAVGSFTTSTSLASSEPGVVSRG